MAITTLKSVREFTIILYWKNSVKAAYQIGSFTNFWQKFREMNVFTKVVTT